MESVVLERDNSVLKMGRKPYFWQRATHFFNFVGHWPLRWPPQPLRGATFLCHCPCEVPFSLSWLSVRPTYGSPILLLVAFLKNGLASPTLGQLCNLFSSFFVSILIFLTLVGTYERTCTILFSSTSRVFGYYFV